MAILWTMSVNGIIYRASDINAVPNGAYMFTPNGEYLGKKKSKKNTYDNNDYNIMRSYWNDLLN